MSPRIVEDFYIKRRPRLMAQFNKLLSFAKEIMAKNFDRDVVDDIVSQMTNEFDMLIPEIPYIGGEKNPFTPILLDCIAGFAMISVLEKKGLSYWEIGEFSYDFWEIINRKRRNKLEKAGQDPAQLLFQENYLQYLGILAKQSQNKRYPEDWVMEFIEGDGKTFDYGLDFSECGVLKFAKKKGMEKYVPFLCLADFAEANITGYGFKRTQTLGNNASKCDQRFSKNGTTPRGWPPEKLQEFKMDKVGEVK